MREVGANHKVCDWAWHDGKQFHHCPLAWPHEGRHARNNGTIPTEAEIREMSK